MYSTWGTESVYRPQHTTSYGAALPASRYQPFGMPVSMTRGMQSQYSTFGYASGYSNAAAYTQAPTYGYSSPAPRRPPGSPYGSYIGDYGGVNPNYASASQFWRNVESGYDGTHVVSQEYEPSVSTYDQGTSYSRGYTSGDGFVRVLSDTVSAKLAPRTMEEWIASCPNEEFRGQVEEHYKTFAKARDTKATIATVVGTGHYKDCPNNTADRKDRTDCACNNREGRHHSLIEERSKNSKARTSGEAPAKEEAPKEKKNKKEKKEKKGEPVIVMGDEADDTAADESQPESLPVAEPKKSSAQQAAEDEDAAAAKKRKAAYELAPVQKSDAPKAAAAPAVFVDQTIYDDDLALGKAAPSLDSLTWISGGPVSYGSNNVVIYFWAKYDTLGHPAIAAMTALQKKYRSLRVVGVNIDPKQEDVTSFLNDGKFSEFASKMDFAAVAWDGGKKLYNAFREMAGVVLNLPHAFFISKEGNIVWREVFRPTDSKCLFAGQVQRFIEDKPLVSNGNKPTEEDETADDVPEDMSLF